ncbi:hypothetical protein Esti_003978 [Eimeria stiedai]
MSPLLLLLLLYKPPASKVEAAATEHLTPQQQSAAAAAAAQENEAARLAGAAAAQGTPAAAARDATGEEAAAQGAAAVGAAAGLERIAAVELAAAAADAEAHAGVAAKSAFPRVSSASEASPAAALGALAAADPTMATDEQQQQQQQQQQELVLGQPLELQQQKKELHQLPQNWQSSGSSSGNTHSSSNSTDRSNNNTDSSDNNTDSSSSSSSGGSSSRKESLTSSEREVVMSMGLLLLLVVVGVSLFLSLAAKRLQQQVLQLPLLATLLGLLLGVMLQQQLLQLQQEQQSSSLRDILALKEEIFFVLLLPPIVFQGGLEITDEPFASVFCTNLGTILWLSVGVTLVSTFLIGGFLIGAGGSGSLLEGVSLSPRHAFAVGALLSSTDPVALLSAFREMKAKRLIHVLVFGESLLNDAVTVVLYRAVADGASGQNLGEAAASFLSTFCASTLLGLFTGAAAALVYKHIDWHHEEHLAMEVALLLLFPWLAYLIADGCGWSGIVAICFCGISMGKYAFLNLSESAQVAARAVFRAIALLVECLVFVFLGLAVCSFELMPFKRCALFLVASLVAIAVARALSVYGTSLVLNLFRGRRPLTLQDQHAIALCGLRGAVAFALAERAQHDFGGGEGQAILTLTLVVALASVLLLTPALLFALRPLGVFVEEAEAEPQPEAPGGLPLHSGEQQQQQQGVGGSAGLCGSNCCAYVRRKLREFDERYLIPFFLSPSRRLSGFGTSATELQACAFKEQQHQQQKQQRRGHGAYMHLPQAVGCLDTGEIPVVSLDADDQSEQEQQ